jgi:hypothetical protein
VLALLYSQTPDKQLPHLPLALHFSDRAGNLRTFPIYSERICRDVKKSFFLINPEERKEAIRYFFMGLENWIRKSYL